MNWFKKKVLKWVDEDRSLPERLVGPTVSAVEQDFSEPYVFKLTKAQGGTIVNTRRYNEQKGRANGDIYIITDDQNLSDEIGKIVSMEMLKL